VSPVEHEHMVQPKLFRLRVDPDAVDRVREHFDELDDRRETFRRGLAMENVYDEAAWLETAGDGPVVYYYQETGEDHPPADLSLDDVEDEGVVELAEDHATFWEEVAAEGADLTSFEPLFFASTLDRED
jgi:hypothetical protein